MIVRLARIEDVEAICSISNRAAQETIANFASQPEPLAMWEASYHDTNQTHPWVVAEEEGAIAGFAKASRWLGRCAYNYTAEVTVYVDPRRHGQGLGTVLYELLFSILEKQGYRTTIAGIAQPNPASVTLHEKFGMKRAGTFDSIGWKFDAWHDVGYWIGHFSPGSPPPDVIVPVSQAMAELR